MDDRSTASLAQRRWNTLQEEVFPPSEGLQSQYGSTGVSLTLVTAYSTDTALGDCLEGVKPLTLPLLTHLARPHSEAE